MKNKIRYIKYYWLVATLILCAAIPAYWIPYFMQNKIDRGESVKLERYSENENYKLWFEKVQSFDPKLCEGGSDNKLYVSVGRTVLGIPRGYYYYNNGDGINIHLGSSLVKPAENILPALHPSEILGCRGNPIQVNLYQFDSQSPSGRVWPIKTPFEEFKIKDKLYYRSPILATVIDGNAEIQWGGVNRGLEEKIKEISINKGNSDLNISGLYRGVKYIGVVCYIGNIDNKLSNSIKSNYCEDKLNYGPPSYFNNEYEGWVFGENNKSKNDHFMAFECCWVYSFSISGPIGNGYLLYDSKLGIDFEDYKNGDVIDINIKSLIDKFINYDNYARSQVLPMLEKNYRWADESIKYSGGH